MYSITAVFLTLHITSGPVFEDRHHGFLNSRHGAFQDIHNKYRKFIGYA